MDFESPTAIPELIRLRVAASPDGVAQVHRSGNGEWLPRRWQEIAERVDRLAAAFQKAGLRPGDRVAVLSKTSHQWQETEFALARIGAVVVGVDPHASAQLQEYVLEDSRSVALIVDDVQRLHGLPAALLQSLNFVVSMRDSSDGDQAPVRNWDSFLKTGDRPPPDAWLPAENSPATRIYTSGTTGTPKAIEYSHGQLLLACRALAREFPALQQGDTTICWLPMAHLFQRMMNLVAAMRGVTTYFAEDPRCVMQAVTEARPSVFVGVPRFFEKLYEGIREKVAQRSRLQRWMFANALSLGRRHSNSKHRHIVQRAAFGVMNQLVLRSIRKTMGGRIKFMITGSAPIDRKLLEFFHAAGLPLLEAYGLSENTVPLAVNRPDDWRPGSVGKPLVENELRLTADGEIEVRGEGVFGGYCDDASGEDLFTIDGFYRTGDLGYFDDDGFLYLTGRKSELIKTSTGRRVSPRAIESVYCRSPWIDHCVVVGNGRRFLTALIVPSQSLNGERNDVRRVIAREVHKGGQSLPEKDRIVAFEILSEPLGIESGELTSTLKLRREFIEQKYAALIERMYSAECTKYRQPQEVVA